jgi:hypothetical protein
MRGWGDKSYISPRIAIDAHGHEVRNAEMGNGD